MISLPLGEEEIEFQTPQRGDLTPEEEQERNKLRYIDYEERYFSIIEPVLKNTINKSSNKFDAELLRIKEDYINRDLNDIPLEEREKYSRALSSYYKTAHRGYSKFMVDFFDKINSEIDFFFKKSFEFLEGVRSHHNYYMSSAEKAVGNLVYQVISQLRLISVSIMNSEKRDFYKELVRINDDNIKKMSEALVLVSNTLEKSIISEYSFLNEHYGGENKAIIKIFRRAFKFNPDNLPA